MAEAVSARKGDRNEETKADVASLERTYTELLEQRIAQLQAQLEQSTPPGKKAPGNSHKESQVFNDAAVEKRPRVRKVVSVWDHETDNRRDYERFDAGPKSSENGGTVFRRIMDSKDEKKLINEELTVESKGLKDLLESVLLHVAPHQFTAEKVTFQASFEVFVWQWDRLVEACKSHEHDSQIMREAREDLRDVLALLEASDALGSYFSNRATHMAGNSTTFDFLWTLFPQGTKIYAKPFMNEIQMFEVETYFAIMDDSGYVGINRKVKTYTIIAKAFDWDGVVFKPYIYGFHVQRFDGTRSVTTLPCFPIAYHQPRGDYNGTRLREELIARGKRFVQLCTKSPMKSQYQYEYTGSVLLKRERSEEQPLPPDRKAVRRVAMLDKSKAIVDNYSFMRSRRNDDSGLLLLGDQIASSISPFGPCPCNHCQYVTTTEWTKQLGEARNTHEEEQLNVIFEQSEERLMLCPPKVLGYSLQLKQWCQLGVDNVKELEIKTTLGSGGYFDEKLEMDKGDKLLLKAMIENHVGQSNRYTIKDAVEGKGCGLVILLHGPPGVGKTLTAETIALGSGKPLVSVSTAEIGIEPEVAEKNLRAIFSDASRWGAVLLIDEADVFLEERKGTRDLQRNALVAVLLRVLEYYEGIIILTTNRIMSLDVAVESRIHLAIQYRDLTKDQMQRIFQNLLDDVDDDLIADRDKIYREVKSMVKRSKLNGRQIRNIVMSSLLLARSEGSRLRVHHIENAMDATHKFLDCLKDNTRDKRAFNEAPSEW